MTGLKGWMTPERAIALQGLGKGLTQLAYGQAPDLSSAHAALAKRQQSAEQKRVLSESGILERFNPDQRAILAQMPPEAAMRVIAGEVFRRPDAPKVTDDMAEYEVAKGQGYQGTIQDWILDQKRAGATSITNNVGPTGVDYGTPPTDMAWQRNEDGTVAVDERGAPIAVIVRGSPSDVKQTREFIEGNRKALDAADVDAAKAETAARSGSVVLEDINRVQEKIEGAPWYSPTAGFFGNIFKDIAGTQAADVAALTQTIRSNIGFDRLQQMREESPTGGALGQVTVEEIKRLESVMGNLEQSQSEGQLLENLDRLEKLYTDIMKKAAAYPNASNYGFNIEVDNDPLGLR